MTKPKAKAPRSSKQSQKKLVDMMRTLEKATVPPTKVARGSCIPRLYCV